MVLFSKGRITLNLELQLKQLDILLALLQRSFEFINSSSVIGKYYQTRKNVLLSRAYIDGQIRSNKVNFTI